MLVQDITCDYLILFLLARLDQAELLGLLGRLVGIVLLQLCVRTNANYERLQAVTYSRALHAQRQLGLGSGFLGHRDDILGLGRLNGSKSVSELVVWETL